MVGLDKDRELIRSLAKRLAKNGAEAAVLRTMVSSTLSDERPRKGSIFAALRRSPLIGVNLDLAREVTPGRKFDL